MKLFSPEAFNNFDFGEGADGFIERCGDIIGSLFKSWSAEMVVKYILSQSFDIHRKELQTKLTLLHIFILSNSVEAVRVLLNAGADPNATLDDYLGAAKSLHLLFHVTIVVGGEYLDDEIYNIAELLLRSGTTVDDEWTVHFQDGEEIPYSSSFHYFAGVLNNDFCVFRKDYKKAIELMYKLFALMACYAQTEKYSEVMSGEFSPEVQAKIQTHIVEIKSKMASQAIVVVDPLKPPSPNG